MEIDRGVRMNEARECVIRGWHADTPAITKADMDLASFSRRWWIFCELSHELFDLSSYPIWKNQPKCNHLL
jgi:hypothetical protein